MKKKLLLLSSLVLSTCTVLQAQNYAVGGSVKAWHNHQDGITSFSVAPDIGYTLSDKWYIGTALGYSYLKKEEIRTNSVSLMPYARYFYYVSGKLKLFVDSTAGISLDKSDSEQMSSSWQAGFKPGVIFGLTERFCLAAGFGFLGYRGTNGETNTLGDSGWGVDISGNSLQIGLYYIF